MAISGLLVFATAGMASAQTTPPPQPEDDAAVLDQITVTGSRIPRQGFVTPVPVTAITAEEIRATGATTIGDLMTSLPQLSSTFTLGNSTRFIGTVGLGQLDLRGLGTARTLVLVNGRRHVGSSSGSTAVDTNTIPVEWVERVEIITGGASAVYGADAVAGVVNFILKREFDGFEVRAQYGEASEGNFDRQFISFSGGNSFADGRGTAAFSLEWSSQERFGRRDRAIGQQNLVTLANPDFDPTQPSSQSNPQRIFTGPGGNLGILTGGRFSLGGTGYVFDGVGTFRPQRFDGPVEGGICVDCDFLDLNAVADLQPALDRISLNSYFSFDLSDNHRLTMEAKYASNRSSFFGQPAFDQPIRIRRDNAYISPELGALMDANGLSDPDSQLLVNRFNVDAGQRGEEVERQTSRVALGLDGYISDNWTYDTYAVYGQTTIDRVNVNNRINERWQAGLDAVVAPDGSIQCRTNVDPDAINPVTGRVYSNFARTGCVPFTVFGDGAVDPAAAAWFNANSVNSAKLTQTVFHGSVGNSQLFSTWAGPVGFAAGLEQRKETSRENTDALAAAGLTFLNAIPSRRGDYSVQEAFAEFSVPLLSGLPFVDVLLLDVAGRYSDYNTIGSTFTWRAGLDWTVTQDFRMRGTLAQAVRAPNIAELTNPQSQNFALIADPCDSRPGVGISIAPDPALRAQNCAALGIPADFVNTFNATRPGVSGGNPDLTEEEARTKSVGFVWQPQFVNGLGVSMDWWQISVTDAIGSVAPQTLANRCVDAPGGIDNSFCALITRAPSTGLIDSQGRVFAPFEIAFFQAIAENLARSDREGVDLEIDYRFNALGGSFTNRFIGTRLLKDRDFAFQDFPDEFTEFVTTVNSPRWRATLGTVYRAGPWRASWDMRYIHQNLRVGLESANNNPGQISPIRNGSYTYHNFRGGFDVNESFNIYIGMDNAFDKDPPLNYFGAGVGDAQYDTIGRFTYVGATYKF